MKTSFTLFSLLALVLLLTLPAFAMAPNGGKVTALTVNTTNVNAATATAYYIDNPTAGCQVRLLRNSSGTKTTANKIPIRANATFAHSVNKATPFLNLSGCTSGVVVLE